MKELKSIFPLYGVFSVAIVFLHFFVLYKSTVWDNDIILVVSLFIPTIFVAVLAIGTGYYQLQMEWRTNSIYLLLSLPVRGWKLLMAKLVAVISVLVMTCIWIGVSFVLILLRVKWDEWRANEDLPALMPTLLNVTANSFWMYCLVVTFMLIVIQFAFLCGQLVVKFKWLVVLSAFFAALWLVFRVSPLLSNLLLWTPEIFFGGKDTDVMYLHSGPFIVLLLTCVGLVWLNGFIFEKEVEV
jgi:hypothetical protein